MALQTTTEMDGKWLQSVVVSRKESRRISRKKLKSDDESDDDGQSILRENFHKTALFELPLELTENGVKLLKDAEVSMHCSMPPSRINGRWTGNFDGRATIESGMNKDPTTTTKASGSISLDYLASSWSRISVGMIRGHELYHPLVSIGGTLISRHGSVVGLQFHHNPSFLHPMLLEHAMYSLSFRHSFPGTRWIFSSELSRTQELSVSVTNSKVNGRMAWNLRKPSLIRVGVDAHPKISLHRKAHVYCNWKLGGTIPGVWQVGASLVQSLHSNIASVGIGIRFVSIRGLEWILSWNRGDASVRVPIVISRTLALSGFGEAMYLSMVSFFIQEALADMWGWKKDLDEETTKSSTTIPQHHRIVSTEKAREDAELQRRIMTRQAERKKSEEEAKDGLVIHKATYEIDGGDSVDVTTQLRFWVAQSTLSLPAMSKQYLLGFYNIGDTRDQGIKSTTSDTTGFSWTEMWNDLWDKSSSDIAKKQQEIRSNGARDGVPTLTVDYEYKRQRYQIKVLDHEALKLPNPKSTKIT